MRQSPLPVDVTTVFGADSTGERTMGNKSTPKSPCTPPAGEVSILSPMDDKALAAGT